MSDELIAQDGSIWNHGPRAVFEHSSLAAPEGDPGAVLVLPDDIVGVRGIERLEPPYDEEWVVLTLAVRRDIGAARKLRLQMGGTERTLEIEAPPEHLLNPLPQPQAQPAAEVAEVQTVTLSINDVTAGASDAVLPSAAPAPKEKK